MVEEVTREGEVAGSNPAGRIVQKNAVTCELDGLGEWLAGGVLLELNLFCFIFLKIGFLKKSCVRKITHGKDVLCRCLFSVCCLP